MNTSPYWYRGKWIDPAAETTANRTVANPWPIRGARRDDRLGTMIRHANACLTRAVVLLSYPVGLTTTFRLLMPAIGCTPLLPPCLFTTGGAAIALASVTMTTDAKDSLTGATATLSKDHCNKVNQLIGRCAPGGADDTNYLHSSSRQSSEIAAGVQKTTFSDDR
jgi:hypothetical protein